jgi:hypothetical protein
MVSSPKPPNPYDQAAADQSASLFSGAASSIINNANETNPYGRVQYSNAGYETLYDAKGNKTYVPRYNRNVTLSPDQQRLLGYDTMAKGNAGRAAVTASGQLEQQFKSPVNAKGLSNWQHAAKPGEVRQDKAPTDRLAVENAMMGRYNERAGKANTAEDAQLAARGMNPGTQGYGNVADTRARALTDASQQAYLGSGEESRNAQAAYNQAGLQRYQMGSDWASSENQLRQNQLQERMAIRNQLPNEIAALMGMGQVTVPQFQGFSRQGINAAQPGGYMDKNYQYALNSANATNSGLFNFGSAVVGGGMGPGGFLTSMFS